LIMGKIPGGNNAKLLVVLSVSGLGYLGIAKAFKIAEVGAALAVLLRRRRS